MLWWYIIQSVNEGCYPMENDWSETLQNNNIICIFTQEIKLFQLNKYDQRVVFYCLFFRVQSIRIQVSRTQPGGFLEQDTSQTINKDAR